MKKQKRDDGGVEIVKMKIYDELPREKIFKELPMMTRDIIITTYCLGPAATSSQKRHTESDAILIILKGRGILEVHGKIHDLDDNTLVRIPKDIPYKLSTTSDTMGLLGLVFIPQNGSHDAGPAGAMDTKVPYDVKSNEMTNISAYSYQLR